MNPKRRSVHIRAANGAVIQEVSVFAIGQGCHHLSESGAEITITNSNSNFGHVSSLAVGYRDSALPQDSEWVVNSFTVADDLSESSNNVREIPIGIITNTANNATTITLTEDLANSLTNPGTPDVIAGVGYTLKEDSLLWVENVSGKDYFSQLASDAWDVNSANQIKVKASFINENGDVPDGTNNTPDLNGKRVYIRRLIDTRAVSSRQYSLRLTTGNANFRTPVRDYVLQTDVSDANIVSEIPDNALITIARSAKKVAQGGWAATADVELRRNNADNTWASNSYYRAGDVVQYANKHWLATVSHTSTGTFEFSKWDENYVHMQESYRPEDFYKNAQPLVLFDDDTDQHENTSTCGWFEPGRNWDDNADLQNQYRTATDYKGIHSFFVSLGFSSSEAHTLLLPKPPAERERNPESSLDGIGNPNGAATAWDTWHVEMRRPSGLRLFAHAWEYTGWSNYTKALPKYQGQLSEANKFTYYFTNEDGGRVYPTGFNEEGYSVSSRGIEDIETGEVQSPEEISSGDQTFIEKPDFDEPAREEDQGLVKLASEAQIDEGINFGTVTPDAAGNEKGFAYVVRSRDLKRVKENFINAVGLLNAVDRIVYVSQDPTDPNQIPDSVLDTDGRLLNDSRSADERRTELCFPNLHEAFEFIDSRNVVTNEGLVIKCFKQTSTDQQCIYRGTTQFMIQAGEDVFMENEPHTCKSIYTTGTTQIFLKTRTLCLLKQVSMVSSSRKLLLQVDAISSTIQGAITNIYSLHPTEK